MTIAVSIKNIGLEIADRTILKNISFEIRQNEHLFILGPNGSGKSSLLKLIFGMRWPSTGSISVLGKQYGECSIADVQKKIGILQPQLQEALIQKNLKVVDILLNGLWGTLGNYRNETEEEKKMVHSLLLKNNLLHLKNQNYHFLSQGEKLKILFLRSIILKPGLLLFDEPTASLDYKERHFFFSEIRQYLAETDCSIILISHRLDERPDFIEKTLMLKKGRIHYLGLWKDVNDSLLTGLYDFDINAPLKTQSGQMHRQ